MKSDISISKGSIKKQETLKNITDDKSSTHDMIAKQPKIALNKDVNSMIGTDGV